MLISLAILCLGARGGLPQIRRPSAPPRRDAALDRLVARCRESESWGLVVIRDGRTILDHDFGKPPACNLMSATKSVTSMAIGALLTDGRLKSVETPVHEILPEFRGGGRESITVRHLLEHTSGLELYGDEFPENRVPAAIAAKVEDRPGTVFVYNNRAVDLLSGVVHRLAGMPLDDYAAKRLFAPLGIPREDWSWDRDPDGEPHGSAELRMPARDFARLGQLMLGAGVWKGTRLLSAAYVKEATAPHQGKRDDEACGWLWWVSRPTFTLDQAGVDRFARDTGLAPERRTRLQTLVGGRWPNLSWMAMDVMRRGGGQTAWNPDRWPDDLHSYTVPTPDARRLAGGDGFFAEGYGGQIMLVLPSRGLLVVRTGGSGFFDTEDLTRYEASDLYALACALAPVKGSPSKRSLVKSRGG